MIVTLPKITIFLYFSRWSVSLIEKFLTHLYRSVLFLPGTWISCVAWSPRETSARCLPECCAGRSSLAITHVLCQKSCYIARERRISVVNSLHLRKIMLHISYVEEDGSDDLFAPGSGKPIVLIQIQ